jgi:hypothetical protein
MKRPQTILGHTLPEPRLTFAGLALLLLAATVPIAIIGSLLDLLVQWLFGVCVGLWCLAAPR